MILKKFFGETLEDAKKQALARYGRNFVVMETFAANGTQQAGITIAVDPPEVAPAAPAPATGEGGFRNVYYKRSGSLRTSDSTADAAPVAAAAQASASRLQRLRSMVDTEVEPVPMRHSVSPGPMSAAVQAAEPMNLDTLAEPRFGLADERASLRPSPGRRFNLRGNDQGGATSAAGGKSAANAAHSATGASSNNVSQATAGLHAATSQQSNGNTLVSTPAGTHWSGSDATISAEALSRTQRDLSAMTKRFDRLEAMMDSSLMTANINMVAHPVFQQLIQTGIQPVTVSNWFRRVIARGVDPNTQSEAFMAQISEIIRQALDRSASDRPDKYILFTGPSGSGKTSLIMKLLKENHGVRRTAVIALLPENESAANYFTILEPFCLRHEIPYFTVANSSEVTTLRESLLDFDQILIDTPSLPLQQDKAFRRYWELRQIFTPLGVFEAHYVVNAAMSKLYFEDPSASHHPLQPDFVAITHLDEVDKLGPIIPFMEGMACKARWVSMSASPTSGLSAYDPAWFARKILQEH
jgi:flagellar biosynthesis GTPase FlhF